MSPHVEVVLKFLGVVTLGLIVAAAWGPTFPRKLLSIFLFFCFVIFIQLKF